MGMKTILTLIAITGTLFIGLLILSRDATPLPFQEQHDLLRGSWILKDVPGADPSFFIANSFADGRYTISGSLKMSDRGTYRITQVFPDGTFEIELTSSRYGFVVTTEVEPLDVPDYIKLDHQRFQRGPLPD